MPFELTPHNGRSEVERYLNSKSDTSLLLTIRMARAFTKLTSKRDAKLIRLPFYLLGSAMRSTLTVCAEG